MDFEDIQIAHFTHQRGNFISIGKTDQLFKKSRMDFDDI